MIIETKKTVFRLAEKNEIADVCKLYEDAKGREFCVWDEFYPTEKEAAHDFETENLYVLCEGTQIVGVLSVVPENELDDQSCWKFTGDKAVEVGRITVKSTHHGKGYAALMVGKISEILKNKGYSAIHISAAKVNIPARKTYAKLDFKTMGEANMYGNEYCLLEKALNFFNFSLL